MNANALATTPEAAHRTGICTSIVLHVTVLLGLWYWQGAPERIKETVPLLVRLIESARAAPAGASGATAANAAVAPTAGSKAKPRNTSAVTATSAPSATTAEAPVHTAGTAHEAPAASPTPELRRMPASEAVAPPASAPAPVTPPNFQANYLDNPAPVYPPLSRRMGEEGHVILRVHVEVSGLPSRVEIRASSGSERLDQAAVDAVLRWKFVPARHGDQPVAAHVLVPVIFSLKG